MANFWDERFSKREYIYGVEPNSFLKEQLKNLSPGRILFPAEGEGRNAAFAASHNWEVFAFDSSQAAFIKASKLFEEKKVTVNYSLNSLEDFTIENISFDCIALIFVHPLAEFRKSIHQNLVRFLKPNGILILEGFAKSQIKYSSGGPKSEDLLFSKEIIKNDFENLEILKLEEKEVFLSEGNYHSGTASVIRFVGRKTE
ncbi:MAG: class I SAM-dependent methyltransferase [Ignavibacteriales bacterium]|nr:class I SAM-dependent methyltransferase [Ignavibacteriota bacterium]MCB9248389.1 class I SAM-dependent methyltransferase [Ignavibacteriales bacterium]